MGYIVCVACQSVIIIITKSVFFMLSLHQASDTFCAVKAICVVLWEQPSKLFVFELCASSASKPEYCCRNLYLYLYLSTLCSLKSWLKQLQSTFFRIVLWTGGFYQTLTQSSSSPELNRICICTFKSQDCSLKCWVFASVNHHHQREQTLFKCRRRQVSQTGICLRSGRCPWPMSCWWMTLLPMREWQ